MVQSLITWDSGGYALIRAARAKLASILPSTASTSSAPAARKNPPGVCRIVVSKAPAARANVIVIKPPTPVITAPVALRRMSARSFEEHIVPPPPPTFPIPPPPPPPPPFPPRCPTPRVLEQGTDAAERPRKRTRPWSIVQPQPEPMPKQECSKPPGRKRPESKKMPRTQQTSC